MRKNWMMRLGTTIHLEKEEEGPHWGIIREILLVRSSVDWWTTLYPNILFTRERKKDVCFNPVWLKSFKVDVCSIFSWFTGNAPGSRHSTVINSSGNSRIAPIQGSLIPQRWPDSSPSQSDRCFRGCHSCQRRAWNIWSAKGKWVRVIQEFVILSRSENSDKKTQSDVAILLDRTRKDTIRPLQRWTQKTGTTSFMFCDVHYDMEMIKKHINTFGRVLLIY